jgi:sodium/hydrogen antiporter
MSFLGWMAMAGVLLMAVALSSAWIQRMPISTAAIYLAVGCAIGPWGFELVRVNLTHAPPWFERCTEIAVVLALFVGGLRLRLPLLHPMWRAAYSLASVVMLGCMAGVAVFALLVLKLEPAVAILLGAILAPTDPVLADAVAVGHSQDHDRMRYALSGEAGLNDGAAFPFVVLALLLLQPGFDSSEIGLWAAHRLIWAVPVGLLVGFAMGRWVGSFAIALRTRNRDTQAPTYLLVLALIALSYTLAEAIGAWGFLSVFASGVGLRRAEVNAVTAAPHPEVEPGPAGDHPPAETLVSPNTVTASELRRPSVAAGVMVAETFSFGDTMERVLEVLLVVVVGVTLATHWDWRGIALGGVLFVVIRPLVVFACFAGSSVTRIQRGLIGWFGIRGIGSLYYLLYAFSHGLDRSDATTLANLTVCVVAFSILAHGLSATPLMDWYNRRQP